MRSLELQRQQIQRLAIRNLSVPPQQRVWEAEVRLTGSENAVGRLPYESAMVLVPGTFIFGLSDFFGSDLL